jgi:hypothetical protein
MKKPCPATERENKGFIRHDTDASKRGPYYSIKLNCSIARM